MPRVQKKPICSRRKDESIFISKPPPFLVIGFSDWNQSFKSNALFPAETYGRLIFHNPLWCTQTLWPGFCCSAAVGVCVRCDLAPWHCRTGPGPLHSQLWPAQLAWHTFRPAAGHGGLCPLTLTARFPGGTAIIRHTVLPTNTHFQPFRTASRKVTWATVGNMTVDRGTLGFIPQKEIVYNDLLPYCDHLDREAAELLVEIKANLSRAVLLRELWPGVAFWSRKLFS